MLSLLTRQRGKLNPLWHKALHPALHCMCQHHYLSRRVPLLIKMNGHLMTGVVSFNVMFVFIFHPNIPLSEDSRVYKPSLQPSRVTLTTQKCPQSTPTQAFHSSITVSPNLSLSLFLCRFHSPPSLFLQTTFALDISSKTDRGCYMRSRLYYVQPRVSSPTLRLLLVADTHRAMYHPGDFSCWVGHLRCWQRLSEHFRAIEIQWSRICIV